MLQILEKRDLSDGGTRDSIVFLLESDLLDSHELSGLEVLCLVDYSVGSFSELLELLVLVEAGDGLGDVLAVSLGRGVNKHFEFIF